jgi:hypothetical protein
VLFPMGYWNAMYSSVPKPFLPRPAPAPRFVINPGGPIGLSYHAYDVYPLPQCPAMHHWGHHLRHAPLPPSSFLSLISTVSNVSIIPDDICRSTINSTSRYYVFLPASLRDKRTHQSPDRLGLVSLEDAHLTQPTYSTVHTKALFT